jgi:hypothetical protein
MLWPEYSGVAIAEDVGIEGKKLVHRFSPGYGITFEILKERSAYVLSKEDPFPTYIKIDCN